MKKEEFDNIVNELLKNKAMTSSDLKDAILDKFLVKTRILLSL